MLKTVFHSILFSFLLAFASEARETPVSPTGHITAMAAQAALTANLEQDPQWLNLLNFRRDYLWIYQSQADSSEFFLSPQGQMDPKAELLATIEKFLDPTFLRSTPLKNQQESAICAFPARFLFLKKKLPVVDWPTVQCSRYNNFRQILDAHSATYVFSSYYLNNPASAYGHSFLRLNRGTYASPEKKYELLDFGVGYSGVPDDSGPLSYAIKGISGVFPGVFEVNPYYFKVREYNNFESRDLWEYDLNLNQEEVDFLVAHLFELQAAHFDYWYLTENCSYRILAALDAVRPSLQLIARTKLQTLPGDTVMTVVETPGFVTKVSYRPSGRAVFENRFASLSTEEKKQLHHFIKDENLTPLSAGNNELETQHLLDAAIDFVDFKYADEILKKTGKYSLKKQILIARSEVPLISTDLVISPPQQSAPEKAHRSAKFYGGFKTRQDLELLTFSHRFALHDLLDPLRGYPNYSEMQMLATEFSYQADDKIFRIEKLSLIEIVSLGTINKYSNSPSWRLMFAWNRDYPRDCTDCLPLIFSGGIGASVNFTNDFVGGLWLQAAAAYDESFFETSYRLGAGPALLLRYNLADRLSLLGEAYQNYDSQSSRSEYSEFSLGAQFNLSDNFGVRLKAESKDFPNARTFETYAAELHYYY